MAGVRDKIRLITDVKIGKRFYPAGSRGLIVTQHGDEYRVSINGRREIISPELWIVEGGNKNENSK